MRRYLRIITNFAFTPPQHPQASSCCPQYLLRPRAAGDVDAPANHQRANAVLVRGKGNTRDRRTRNTCTRNDAR